jgi:hypothetical protein
MLSADCGDAAQEYPNDIAVLIDRPIQIVSLSLVDDKELVEMPRIV